MLQHAAISKVLLWQSIVVLSLGDGAQAARYFCSHLLAIRLHNAWDLLRIYIL